MRAVHPSPESGDSFSKAGKNSKKHNKNRDPKAAVFAQQRRNTRRLPNRRLQRGR
ncbi:hypothetical protein Acsp04_57010 [Actinomadura sp. NBRC 104425]|uniref:hypothetical protein n=1 Tax=Actinomadura sp. NBRC 104425 TaxID=3032204 RepID=UPI0024A44B48|nr:hypothetical protein [Actinomadura sp. NBRC 104425]GLZ15466.1 hypothetical protein Acsp04_57010 [Actinomadura sp. NBRC 104425]